MILVIAAGAIKRSFYINSTILNIVRDREGVNVLSYCCDFIIGDLVCLKSHNNERPTFGWISLDLDSGIVLDIIEVEHPFELYDYRARCYDYVVYWCKTGTIETIPDVLLVKYTDWLRRLNAK